MQPTERKRQKPAAEAGFKWFKDEPNERARSLLAVSLPALGMQISPGPTTTARWKSKTIGSNTELDEVERTLKAIKDR